MAAITEGHVLLHRSTYSANCLPTLKTGNNKILLLLPSGESGLLRISDAERAQVPPHPSACQHTIKGILMAQARTCRTTLNRLSSV